MFGHKEAILWFIECNLKIQLRYNLQSEATCKVCADKHSISYPALKLKKKDSRWLRQDGSKNKSNESLQKQIFKSIVTAYVESIACAPTSIKRQVIISMCVVPLSLSTWIHQRRL